MKKLSLPIINKSELDNLTIGDTVLLSGVIYTGRDAAHRRILELINKGEPMPIDINNQGIYYTGPCPAPVGKPIGSCGPTTSGRMDAYAPTLIAMGQKVMIGKGERTQEVIDACIKYGCVYLAAVGGAGAYLAACVEECSVVAFPDLGTEAIHRLVVKDMPLIVAIDTKGGNLYATGRQNYIK